jgi:hypothetical protein
MLSGIRWTDGYAVAPSELFAGFAGSVEIVLTIVGTAHYPDDSVRRQVA